MAITCSSSNSTVMMIKVITIVTIHFSSYEFDLKLCDRCDLLRQVLINKTKPTKENLDECESNGGERLVFYLLNYLFLLIWWGRGDGGFIRAGFRSSCHGYDERNRVAEGKR